MPHFEPAFDMTPLWEEACATPTGVIVRFHGQGDAGELYRFIEIWSVFEQLYQKGDLLYPEPMILTTRGNRINTGLLNLVKKHKCVIDVSFVLFGEYFREVLREYCFRSIEFHDDEEVQDGFERVLALFRIDKHHLVLN